MNDDKREARKIYMRQYQLTRYYKNQQKALDEQNTMRIKKRMKIPQEDIDTFGIHLANVIKLKKLITIIPPEILAKVQLNV
jgi:hypothetical protein